ncbi:MAG: OadG family protein [Candidatus Competibacter denitrificans]
MKNYTTWDAIGDMFIIYSIVVVISMLVAAVIRGIVILLSRQAAKTEAQGAAKKSAPVAARPAISGIPQEHIVAISAAVTMMMGAHRIVRIEMAHHGFGWTSEARAAHHTSHLPRGPH